MAQALIEIGPKWGRYDAALAGQTLAGAAGRFQSDIVVVANGRRANAKDVMSVVALRAKCGTQMQILSSGPDEDDALDSLASLLTASR
ncbi:HPr family phosphocarrier protein [Burkholderia oklahomensis]|uniref:HPr family phosphocarrier protein n=1 Tax=Burkholderia oklahomensis TaxID=342113 RepID=UPI0002D90949|nr:HPr family phosphocarrier protein [Burkholderia oklahomensis]AJX35177.1 PTS HPr component phosphorylation site family protein [Burkholderia oklahomensis C6786]AOI48949.1 phosphate ABC transporter permease [Burkholderia oklahomensis C6786]KUY50451.1 phosphate ABC transporter permease [Burkholderia oklahomensis C6786]MBI0362836.1 HPr family phosphocarrier protein [Burkholderia oklahomensis]MDN7675643.1 HPr family phosphocarrier protein [Burkholderia oklahomensis]